jgi:hypothetical protein
VEDLRHRGEGNIKMDHKYDMRVWTAFIWVQVGSSGGLV